MNYEKIYNQIIQRAKDENRKKVKGGIYYEGHHIIPKCMGGMGNSSDRHHPNIILLTAKEHYICHRLLALVYNTHQLHYALWCMINGLTNNKNRYKASSRIYESLRESYIIHHKSKNRLPLSDEIKQKISNSNKGKSKPPLSAETRQKISNAGKGRIISDETKKKISESNKGKSKSPMSDDTKKKISIAVQNRPPMSKETKKKMSNSGKLRVHTKESKEKMSEIKRLYHLNKRNNFDI
jgi:hypothetical protein